MKAKRILAGVCASVMLATAAVPVVSAADSVKVTVGSAKAKAGETFSVKVDLADIPAAGINGCDFGIQYDASVISITGVEKGAIAVDDTDALDGVKSLEANYSESGLVSIIYGVSGTKIATGGTFITLSGKVNASAAAGKKSDLKIVAIDRTAKPAGTETNADIIFGYLQDDNKTFVNYTPTIVNGVVEVEGETVTPTQAPVETQAPTQAPVETQAPTQAPVETQAPTQAPDTQPNNPEQGEDNKPDKSKRTKRGDVDVNGYVEINDIVVLCKYLINPKAYPLDAVQLANADCNDDGKVDTTDLSMIIEYNLNPAKHPLD